MDPEIKNLPTTTSICGPPTRSRSAQATVKVYPGENLMVHKALDVSHRSDIVVIDAGSTTMNALVGDLACTKASHRGIQAFVVDGLIRDLADVPGMGFPVFARGVTPIGPLHRGPGEINFPVVCRGIVVNPRDIHPG